MVMLSSHNILGELLCSGWWYGCIGSETSLPICEGVCFEEWANCKYMSRYPFVFSFLKGSCDLFFWDFDVTWDAFLSLFIIFASVSVFRYLRWTLTGIMDTQCLILEAPTGHVMRYQALDRYKVSLWISMELIFSVGDFIQHFDAFLHRNVIPLRGSGSWYWPMILL